VCADKQDNCQMNYKNFQETIIPEKLFKAIDPRKLIEKYKIGRSCFPACPIGCGQVLYLYDGKFRGLKVEKSQWEAFSTLQTRLAVDDPQFVIMANALANQLGVDVDMVGGTIGWAIECFEKGIISEKDTGGIQLTWGNVDQIIELIKMICYREGFGNLLAEGCTRASEVIGRNSYYYCMQIKKQELYEPLRGAMAWALGTAVSTRGGGHTTGVPGFETTRNLDPKRMSNLYGIKPEDVDPLEYEGKPEIVFFTEILQRVANCLGICHFNTIWFDLDYIGLEDMAELYSSATGIDITADEFKTITLRQLNLEKIFNIRHAKFDRKDDLPTARDLSEPIPSGKLAGWKIDVDKWNKMLDKYYELHGWDKKNGYPRKETLDDLGIGYAYKDILKAT
jgi:aldehyde:ferredoxin oxidoreductase